MLHVDCRWCALVVTAIFALTARLLRGVTNAGSLAGAVVCYLLYIGAGPGGILALLTVFILAWVTTRFRRSRKQNLGTAERADGRSASQVLANLAIAAACAAIHARTGSPVMLLLISSALSEAAADTVSSEVGQVSANSARLITTGKPVPAGTDGGVTLPGTLAGVVAAVIVTLVCSLTGVLPWSWFSISLLAATVGMFADSLLGALLERRDLLNNDAVNFLGTAIAAFTAFVLS